MQRPMREAGARGEPDILALGFSLLLCCASNFFVERILISNEKRVPCKISLGAIMIETRRKCSESESVDIAGPVMIHNCPFDFGLVDPNPQPILSSPFCHLSSDDGFFRFQRGASVEASGKSHHHSI